MRLKNTSRIAALLLIICAAVFLFAGCNSKTAAAAAKGSDTVEKSNGQRNGRMDSAAMEARYEAALGSLVADGTLTQDQSDQVLAEITKGMPQPGSQNAAQDAKPDFESQRQIQSQDQSG